MKHLLVRCYFNYFNLKTGVIQERSKGFKCFHHTFTIKKGRSLQVFSSFLRYSMKFAAFKTNVTEKGLTIRSYLSTHQFLLQLKSYIIYIQCIPQLDCILFTIDMEYRNGESGKSIYCFSFNFPTIYKSNAFCTKV